MDFISIYSPPGVQKKESPFKEWSAALRKVAGIWIIPRSDFALIRGATSDVHHFPVSLQTYINANLTEHKHDAPSAETLEKAGHVSSAAVTLDAVKRLSMEMKVCLTGTSLH